MADHHELVAEMAVLEQMGAHERQRLAKKKRLQQLKRWSQREKDWIAKDKQMNKRLATLINEENNGLNLKHFTQYSMNDISPIKSHKQAAFDSFDSTNNHSNVINNNNNNNSTDHKVNGKLTNGLSQQQCRMISSKSYDNVFSSALTSKPCNGKVQFDSGVMLLEAAARNDFDEVRRLLMIGVSPNSTNHDGLTALHQCCIEANEAMMQLLLEFGAKVDSRDSEQWTPMHAACTCGHLNLVKILVKHGADLLAVNGDGNMPFDICEDEQTLDYLENEMVKKNITQQMIDYARTSTEMKLLQDLKELNDFKDNNTEDIRKCLNEPINEQGVTLLHVASANGYLEAVKYLLEHGASVDICDHDLWQPLHGAACWLDGNESQHLRIVELLVEHGASLEAKTAQDETVFDLCSSVQILDRLNGLKDEIELRSKQLQETSRPTNSDDSDPTKFKRTQSRSNSRIHSVRRIRARDKEQTSRREAREEAMLRVCDTEDGTGNGLSTTEITNDGRSDPRLVTGEASEDRQQTASCRSIESGETLQQASNQNETKHNNNDRTNDCVIYSHDNQQAIRGNGSWRQPDLSKISDNLRVSEAYEKNSKLPDGSPRKQPTRSLPENITNINIDSSTPSSVHDHDTQQQQPVPPPLRLGDLKRPNQGGSSGNIYAKASSNSSVAETSNQAHDSLSALQPIGCFNYTLSNLKKQRSDLRMRTTSIGGHADGQQQVHQDTTDSPAGRAHSPTSDIRKFIGEPSDSIFTNERSSRLNCCIII